MFSSYLIVDTHQWVKNFKSFTYKVNSEVPQGSNFPSLRFNLFINDIKFTNSHKLLFDDDVKMYLIIKSPADSALFQDDHNIFSNWCQLYNLFLNFEKCKIMTFLSHKSYYYIWLFLNNIELKRVYLYKDLGIFLDYSLSFNDYYIFIKQSIFNGKLYYS